MMPRSVILFALSLAIATIQVESTKGLSKNHLIEEQGQVLSLRSHDRNHLRRLDGKKSKKGSSDDQRESAIQLTPAPEATEAPGQTPDVPEEPVERAGPGDTPDQPTNTIQLTSAPEASDVPMQAPQEDVPEERGSFSNVGPFFGEDATVSNNRNASNADGPIFQDEGNTTTSGLFIKLTDDMSSCISYNASDPTSIVEVTDCEVAAELALWEIISSEDPSLLQLRHLDSQLCMPENPESPERAFNCWINEDNQAVADTINGLVDCSSPYAAFMGFIDSANPSYLYNAICSTGSIGADSDVVLMAYTINNETQVLWGEKILLDIPQGNNPFSLYGDWVLEETML